MGQFFGKEFSGGPFVLFSAQHLIAIGVIIAVNLIIYAFRGRFSPRARSIMRWGLAGLLIVDELAWHVWNITTGQWSIQTTLPLHLCSVFVFLSAYMLAARSYKVYEFAYLIGIAGAMQAVLTPDLGIYAFPHFRYFQVFISHGSIITAALFMTFVEGYRPTSASIKRVLIISNIYMAAVGVVNWLIGSNYLFIAHKPATASLIDSLGPWPWYILGIEAVGIVAVLLLYLPFAVKDWRTKAVAAAA